MFTKYCCNYTELSIFTQDLLDIEEEDDDEEEEDDEVRFNTH